MVVSSKNIQILRGLAIIAVVLIHNTPVGLAQVMCRPFLNFCVGLFLFMSAMLSSADKWNPWKRIWKVIVPYTLWTIIYVAMANIAHPADIPAAFLKNLLTAKSAAPMYYVFVYCEFTLLIPIVDKLARSKYNYIGFLISPIEIIIMRLIPLITGTEINAYIRLVMGVSCLGWFTYYYLGYMLGNNIIEVKVPNRQLIILLAASIIIQMIEGYLYYIMGESNCGTQLKLSSILTGSIFVQLAYRFVYSSKEYNFKILKLIGDNSFGIYFSHIAVMCVLGCVPYYWKVVYPINVVIIIIVDLVCITIGKRMLGEYSKYLAL